MLCRGRRLALFAKCVRERMYVDGLRGFDGDVRILCVQSGFLSAIFCPSSQDYDRAWNVLTALTVKGCVKRDQMVYGNPEFGAQEKKLNSFVLIRGKRDRRDER